MQLDQATITIAERPWVDNLDLALHVARRHFWPLLGCGLAGILPFALLNQWMFAAALGESDDPGDLFATGYWLLIFVMIEAPLATAPVTLFLGQALFDVRSTPRAIAREYFTCLPQMLVLQVALRAVLIIPVITWIIPYVVWPYLNEVILLERNPLMGSRGQISTLARSGILHRANSGDFLVRGMMLLLVAPLLVASLFGSQWLLAQWLLGYQSEGAASLATFQAVLWIVACYFTVARFLSYLDQRIRNEGWEVELLLRAQRERIMRQIA